MGWLHRKLSAQIQQLEQIQNANGLKVEQSSEHLHFIKLIAPHETSMHAAIIVVGLMGFVQIKCSRQGG